MDIVDRGTTMRPLGSWHHDRGASLLLPRFKQTKMIYVATAAPAQACLLERSAATSLDGLRARPRALASVLSCVAALTLCSNIQHAPRHRSLAHGHSGSTSGSCAFEQGGLDVLAEALVTLVLRPDDTDQALGYSRTHTDEVLRLDNL